MQQLRKLIQSPLRGRLGCHGVDERNTLDHVSIVSFVARLPRRSGGIQQPGKQTARENNVAETESVRYVAAEGVATITIHRPEVLNALNAATLAALEQAVARAAAAPEVRVLLLTGAGEKAFVAGADIRELAAVTPANAVAMAQRGQRVMDAVESCGKPVIACVNGFALGGGCELALACTLRIASSTATFGQPEVKLGILPGYGGTQRLPRLVGPAEALRIILTGAMVSAEEALRIGLVNEVVPPEQLMERAHALARSILAVAPQAVTACLQAVQQGADLPLRQGLDLEAELFGRLCRTQDKTEGTTAFLEKRKPQWTGR
ncbi:MAG: enoyl-CoA hydratase/isomerase family protein [Acidobacteriota bacterium]|nr:enoyl-CoA hydratase/isomerase family protein [Acidobacteriota bacterium]